LKFSQFVQLLKYLSLLQQINCWSLQATKLNCTHQLSIIFQNKTAWHIYPGRNSYLICRATLFYSNQKKILSYTK